MVYEKWQSLADLEAHFQKTDFSELRAAFDKLIIGAAEFHGLSRKRCVRDEKGIAFHYTIWCNIRMDQLSAVLTAISHPTRRSIIGRLANGPARFSDIAEPFDTALNAVTKHLKLLERAGLIERRRQGREVIISFRGEPLREVADWMNEYERFWNERLDMFERHFREKKMKAKKERPK